MKKHIMYLEDMVSNEKAADGGIAIDTLQWLRRSLHFWLHFLIVC